MNLNKGMYRSFRYTSGIPAGPANARRMFFLLLPSGIFGATCLPFVMVSAIHGGDDHGSGAACIMLVAAPLALACGVVAVIEAIRKDRGGSAFIRGALWNVLLVAIVSLIFYLFMRTGQR